MKMKKNAAPEVFRELLIADVTDAEPDTFEVMFSFPALSKYFGRYHLKGKVKVKALLERNLGRQKAASALKELHKSGIVCVKQRFNPVGQNVAEDEIPIIFGMLFSTIEDLLRSVEVLTKFTEEISDRLQEVESKQKQETEATASSVGE
ncbi:MAG: hypothetical protein ABSG52_00595 [Terriglobales bacterium]|jgi:hypothetical protein